MTEYKSIKGTQLGLDKYGALAAIAGIFGQKRVTDPVAHAVIAVGAEAADTRTITIKFYDAKGKPYLAPVYFEILMFTSAAMTAFMSGGGSTGVAIGAKGALQAIVAKLKFAAISDVNGEWAGSYLDTATAAGFIAVKLPNGVIVPGALVTNA